MVEEKEVIEQEQEKEEKAKADKHPDVKTDNLAVGMVVKNYREFCRLLEQAPTTGCSKKSQMANWERFFAFEKQGVKYVITEIYDEPLPLSFSSMYAKYIEKLLMLRFSLDICQCFGGLTDDILQKIADQRYFMQIYETVPMLLYDLGMITQGLKEDRNKFAQEGVSPTFKFIGDDMMLYLRQILRRALDLLQDRRLLSYETSFIIYEDKYHSRPATSQERSDIMDIEARVLEKMGMKSISMVFVYNCAKEFYETAAAEVNKKLNMNGWYISAYHITLLPHGIKWSLKNVLQEYYQDYMGSATAAITKATADVITDSGKLTKMKDNVAGDLNNYLVNNMLEKNQQHCESAVRRMDNMRCYVEYADFVDTLQIIGASPEQLEDKNFILDRFIDVRNGFIINYISSHRDALLKTWDIDDSLFLEFQKIMFQRC